jgi:hypothetical protein
MSVHKRAQPPEIHLGDLARRASRIRADGSLALLAKQ